MVGFPDPPRMIIFQQSKIAFDCFPLFLFEMVKQKLKMCLVFSKGQRKFTTRTNVSKYVGKVSFQKSGISTSSISVSLPSLLLKCKRIFAR